MRQLAQTFWRATGGTTAVEFGMLVAPFLVLVFGSLQVFIVLLAQQMLETSAEAAGRTILTGNAQGVTQTAFQQSICKSMPAILNCNNVMIDVQVATSFSSANTSAPTLTYDKFGNVTNLWSYNTGNAGDIVVMRVMYQWPMFNMLTFQVTNLQNNSRLLIATAVFKNEAF